MRKADDHASTLGAMRKWREVQAECGDHPRAIRHYPKRPYCWTVSASRTALAATTIATQARVQEAILLRRRSTRRSTWLPELLRCKRMCPERKHRALSRPDRWKRAPQLERAVAASIAGVTEASAVLAQPSIRAVVWAWSRQFTSATSKPASPKHWPWWHRPCEEQCSGHAPMSEQSSPSYPGKHRQRPAQQSP